MIARHWRGWTSRENADAYERLLRTEILPGIRTRLEGTDYRGVILMRRDPPDGAGEVEFATLMFFDSLDTVRAFAGEDYEHGVVPPAARALLARFDERSTHFAADVMPGARLDPG
ncbi:MAG TPA: hypothetical protein VD978_11455 [Azospirillum sp.]|nr:hypothetical protein [Azospirillum sp.]